MQALRAMTSLADSLAGICRTLTQFQPQLLSEMAANPPPQKQSTDPVGQPHAGTHAPAPYTPRRTKGETPTLQPRHPAHA